MTEPDHAGRVDRADLTRVRVQNGREKEFAQALRDAASSMEPAS